MLNRRYLLEKPAAPPPWKLYFNQQMLPKIINTAAVIEAAAEHVAVRTRRSPLLALAIAITLGALGGQLRRRPPGQTAQNDRSRTSSSERRAL